MPKIIAEVSDIVFQKFMKMKRDRKLKGKGWEPLITDLTKNMSLSDNIGEAISKSTKEGLFKLWSENFAMNFRSIVGEKDLPFEHYPDKKDMWSIGLLPKKEMSPALFIAAGPSVRERGHVELLARRGWKGVSLATDRMLIPLLKAGYVPNYVVSVDGNRELIVKWFDDPIVDEYAPKIIGIFCSTVAKNAVDRFRKAGGEVRWFHGMMDSFFETDSVTSMMNFMTGSTALSAGGNVGATCFTVAHYLHCNPIVAIGLDLGYNADTPIEQTAYYDRLYKPGVPMEQLMKLYKRDWNPSTGKEYLIDVVFVHYRDALREMVLAAKREFINSTEGGSLFGEGIKCLPFSEVLDKYGER